MLLEPPLPLSIVAANKQAMRLRADGLSYNDISKVMARYHGHRLTDRSWRERCRFMGAAPSPRGIPFEPKVTA